MNTIDPPQIKRPYISTFIIPSFIVDAARKANINLMELTDYRKLRQVCSLEDIAVFANIHDNARVGIAQMSTLPLSVLMARTGAPEREAEVTLTVMPQTEEIKAVAKSFLGDPIGEHTYMFTLNKPKGVAEVVHNTSPAAVLGNPQQPSPDLPYQLETIDTNVFIIVGPGFSTYVGTSGRGDTAQAFVRDFIKHCSAVFGPVEVAKHPLFVNFLNSLAV